MWVFARDGFFSVVEDRANKHKVLVRARLREDAVRAMARMRVPKSALQKTNTADYLYRFSVGKGVWADYLREEAMSINYDNVKDNIAKEAARHFAYMRVWSILNILQEDEELKQKEARSCTTKSKLKKRQGAR